MWLLLQGSIIFAVCASNIHWTPNGYLPAMIGAGLAWAVSQAIADWHTLRMRKRVGGNERQPTMTGRGAIETAIVIAV